MTGSSQPKGTIGAQSPSGTASRGAVISLKVSRGNGVTVPDVSGMTRDDAENTLRSAGFKVDRNEQDVLDPTQDGIVVGQSPAGGSAAKSGDRVTITIGKFGGPGGPPGDGDGPQSPGNG